MLTLFQIWLPSIMIAWGIVTTCTGTAQSYYGLLIARIFLGVAEAGLYPGVAFYLTNWYAPEDLALVRINSLQGDLY